MRRFIVIVLDGFGIGEMEDVRLTRPQDVDSDTYGHIKGAYPDMHLPNLEKLGLLDARGEDTTHQSCIFGRSKLAHFGADTFYGHQELMCTKPILPKKQAFGKVIDQVEENLIKAGYKVRRVGEVETILIVNDSLSIADNIECDLGAAINVTASLDLINFDEVKKVGELVRNCVTVPRVIAFGGAGITLSNIIEAVEVKGEYIGVSAPRSGVYNENYQCVHLGYGVDASVQVPEILAKSNIKTYLVGKVADIVHNPSGESFSCVPTKDVFEKTLELLQEIKEGFICANVQETDLAGHSQDTKRYKAILEEADSYIGKLIDLLQEADRLIIMADHGNDPTIGHTKHTREYVPLLVYKKGQKHRRKIEDRQTLADVGASVLWYLSKKKSTLWRSDSHNLNTFYPMNDLSSK